MKYNFSRDFLFFFKLAADAGSMIPMTEAEKTRLEELLSDETDLLMVEVTQYSQPCYGLHYISYNVYPNFRMINGSFLSMCKCKFE